MENKTLSIKELKELLNSIPESIVEKNITNLKGVTILCEGTLLPKIIFEIQ